MFYEILNLFLSEMFLFGQTQNLGIDMKYKNECFSYEKKTFILYLINGTFMPQYNSNNNIVY